MSNSSLQPARLIVQLSTPVADAATGEKVYQQLKDLVKGLSNLSTINGQIIQQMEPCCNGIKREQP